MAIPVRVVITANSALGVAQIKSDFLFDSALQITTATTIDQLGSHLLQSRPDVVLLDTQLAGEGTASLVAELTYKQKVPVVLQTGCNGISQNTLLDSLYAGALAVLHKPSSTDLLARHILSLIWSIKAAASALPIPPSADQ